MKSLYLKKITLLTLMSLSCSYGFTQPTSSTNTNGVTNQTTQPNNSHMNTETSATMPSSSQMNNTNSQNSTTAPGNAAISNQPESSSDSRISAGVQSNISKDNSLAGSNVSVTTQNGTTTLSGTVNNKEQEAAAINAARSASGVSDVKSNLTISNQPNNPSGDY